jgi:hypothetical protein
MAKKARKKKEIAKTVDTKAQPDRSFSVVIDTKEKQPWTFCSGAILGTEYRGLKTGDYTVEGLEDILCIERKRSVNELAGNIHEARFHRELERMTAFPYRYLLLESSLEKVIEYPRLEDLPPAVIRKIRVSGTYLLKCLNRMQVKYGVNIIYCGNTNNAIWVATNIMKEVVNLHYAEDN